MRLVGVAGLAGCGKTTAVEYLAKLFGGRVLYLGQTVLDEVRARGLAETRGNESRVRFDLRRKNGPAALALPHVDMVKACVGGQIPVFVDAIFTNEEFEVLTSRLPTDSADLLAIDASFDTRGARLARRPERTFSLDELRKRDKVELEQLGTAEVIAAAHHSIRNEGTLDEFYGRLAEFMNRR